MYNAINITANQQSIGGRLLYPGESRLIDESEVAEAMGKGLRVPDYAPPAQEKPAEPAGPPTIQQILKAPVKELLLDLPTWTDEQLLKLEEAEKQSETPRETLLRGIEKEIARRSPK